MNRRKFMTLVGVGLADRSRLATYGASDGWRTFELKTRVEVLHPSGRTRAWLPEVLIRNTPFQRSLATDVSVEGGPTDVLKRGEDALGIIVAEFPANVRPTVTLTSRVATKDYAVDLTS